MRHQLIPDCLLEWHLFTKILPETMQFREAAGLPDALRLRYKSVAKINIEGEANFKLHALRSLKPMEMWICLKIGLLYDFAYGFSHEHTFTIAKPPPSHPQYNLTSWQAVCSKVVKSVYRDLSHPHTSLIRDTNDSLEQILVIFCTLTT